MILHYNDTQLEIITTDSSYRYRALKAEHTLTLYFSLPEFVEIPVGAYCVFEGLTYTLETLSNVKRISGRNIEYTVVMDAPQAKARKYKFKDIASRRIRFSLTAKPHEHLQAIVDNMNLRESGWAVGTCLEASEKVIAYNSLTVLEALELMANEFKTEWEISGKTISLGKVEYNRDVPLALSYGKGNGFKSGVGRESEGKGVEVLHVQGGSRNIDASKYGSSDLLLPKGQTLIYEGRTYISDADGYSVRRGDKNITTGVEDALDLTHIYPSRVGTISIVVTADESKHFYDFTDDTIPVSLDYNSLLIAGDKMTVIFQDGMLAGREFEVKYIHSGRRFEIVPQEIDGQTVPNSIFKPVAGNKYAVFHVQLPEAYVRDDATQSGASWDMFREAVKFLYENEEDKFSFTGELDGVWASENWLNIGGKVKLGGYVRFSDKDFAKDGILLRIVGVKDYINKPHSPLIELSNAAPSGTLYSELRKLEGKEIIEGERYRDALQYTKRRYRDSEETLKALEKAMLEGFTDSISPITLKTMAMLVGDESLQFRFVDDTLTPAEVPLHITYNNETKVLELRASVIQHMTFGINKISSSYKASDYRFWTLPRFLSPALSEANRLYYIYAKVNKTGSNGEFLLSETAIAMESVEGYYHLLIGLLSKDIEGVRSYARLYGFTEILPGRITVDVIQSPSGDMVIDLNNSRIKGNIEFISAGQTKDLDTWAKEKEKEVDDLNTTVYSIQSTWELIPVSDKQVHAFNYDVTGTLNTLVYSVKFMRGGKDVTSIMQQSGLSLYNFERKNTYGFDDNNVSDASWNAAHVGAKTVTLTDKDIYAVGTLEVVYDETILETEYKRLTNGN